MKRVRMVLAYDGTNYCGWQLQPNGITIEEVLNKALSELLREPIMVIGASRTDSGVHAEGNVAVFDTENRMPAEKICFAINQRLPEDIRVLQSDEVPLDWHPRKQNCRKTYEYRILNRSISIPTLRLYAHFSYFNLDIQKMQQAASYLVGEHDFKSFCTVRTQAEETVRTIYSLDVTKTGDMITIRISGSGFLYNMVRIIAGTLMKVGMGVYPPEHVEEILEARDRQAAGPTAPARGLTLISMEYEETLCQKITGNNKHWSYELIQTEVPEKRKAYLVINRCEEEEFERLLTRVTHQAVRNGAQEVFVCDREMDREVYSSHDRTSWSSRAEDDEHAVLQDDRDPCRTGSSRAHGKERRILPGKAYGYYQFTHAHDMLVMQKQLQETSEEGQTDMTVERVCREDSPIRNSSQNLSKNSSRNPSRNLSKNSSHNPSGDANISGRLQWVAVQEENLEEYCQLVNEIFRHVPNSATLTVEELQERIPCRREHVLWLKQQEETVGFLMLVEKGAQMEIDEIGIAEPYRRQGLAREVLASVEALAADRGMKEIRLLVSEQNVAARQLYESLGYQMVSVNSSWYHTTACGYQG